MRPSSKLFVLSCLVLVFLGRGVYACEEPLIPGIPNPDLAGEEEMLRAQAEVRLYIQQQEDYLSCIEHNTRKHNRAVDVLHDVANKYNSTARRYKMRMRAKNMITELALLDVSRF